MDINKANHYFYRGANLNDPPYIRELGTSHWTGDGTTKDIDMAILYYKKAAKLECGPTQFELASALRLKAASPTGNARMETIGNSAYWFQKAALNPELAQLQDAALD